MTARFALKDATDEAHRTLDDRLSRLDLAERADYRRFLLLHGTMIPPLEAAIAGAGVDDVLPGWSASRRTGALLADLTVLGEAVPAPAVVATPASQAEMLGMAYVLEGSRLGGRVLGKQVGEGFPAQFLTGNPTLGAWPNLIAVLEQSLYSNALLGEAQESARRCFAQFLEAADEAGI